MKRHGLCVVVVVAVFAAGCSSVTPIQGQEAVLVRKPMFFGSGGVDGTPVQPGRRYVAWTTDAVYVNMQPELVSLEFDDLFSANGVPLDFQAAVRYRVTDAVRLVRDFGVDRFFQRNVEAPFRDALRDAVKARDMDKVVYDTQTSADIQAEVREATEAIVKRDNLPIMLLDVTPGRANPPDRIKNQREETAAQVLRQQTEQQGKLAEDARKMREESRASADRAYNERMGLNTEQYVMLEQIKALREACGKGGCTFLMGAGLTPVLNVR